MIEVERSAGHIRGFMNSPEIYRYAAEYGAGEINPTFERGEVWLSYVKDGLKVGMISLYVVTGSMCQCHPYILRAYRDNYETMLRELFKWFIDNMPKEAIKLNAIIPTLFSTTIEIVKKVGGKVEGIDRQSYRRTKTRVYDRVLLGITREEMKNG